MLALTYLPPVPMWVVLIVTTAFFVFVSGRMVPGMALMTAVPPANMRGAFMSVNGALQSASMGIAVAPGDGTTGCSRRSAAAAPCRGGSPGGYCQPPERTPD